MSFIVSASGGFERAPEGQYAARCYQIVDLGLQEGYQGQLTRKVAIAFELEEKMSDGRPFVASKWVTLSLHPKANLSQMLNSWRGKAMTPDELKGFDLEKLLGAPALVQIIEDVNEKGYETSYIGSVTKLPKSMTVPDPVNEAVCISYDNSTAGDLEKLTDGMKNRVMEGWERLSHALADKKPKTPPKAEPAGGDDLDDDIPF